MPFDDPRENQDESVTPRRFGYPLADDDEDDGSIVPIGVAPYSALRPRQTNATVWPALQGAPRVEPKPGIGQQIVEMANREMPGFDLQNGRAVWRSDPRTLPKPNIGRQILGIRPSGTGRPTLLPGVKPVSWTTSSEPLPFNYE